MLNSFPAPGCLPDTDGSVDLLYQHKKELNGLLLTSGGYRGIVDVYLSILRPTAIVFIIRNDVAPDVLFR